ncbi:MAG: hypothetical protein E7430_01430 [Ruminococcaceae bacterium]|nr:hypothetical protein [Oscillospiraceae bacterium]
MKRRLITILLVAAMLTSFVFAYSDEQVKAADALNELGLFLGTGTSYDLDNYLTRAQGVTLLVRMMGKEDEASNGNFKTGFTDVPDWAKGYIGYAFVNDITKGVSETSFDPDTNMTDYMFLTLTLRALGYSDSGNDPMFVWNDPYQLAYQVGLISAPAADNDFTRADAVEVFWNALSSPLYGQNKTLSESLVEQDVFTDDELEAAETTQREGRKENAGIPIVRPGTGTSGSTSSGSGSNNNTDDKEVIGGGDTSGGTTGGSSGTDSGFDPSGMTYEEYQALSAEEQQAFFEKFESMEDFMKWHQDAKAEYDAEQDYIEIGGDTVIDLGEIINGKA